MERPSSNSNLYVVGGPWSHFNQLPWGLAYLSYALVVGMMMRLFFMCFGTDLLLCRATELSSFNQRQHIPQNQEIVYIGWKKPQDGRVKLNCDGACKELGETAGCGGLFRVSDGRSIKGFSRKIGACDALHAEMWGMYLGMDIAWMDGLSHLIVESDSKVLINMVTNKCNIKGHTPSLIWRIQEFMQKDWQIRFVHTWREGNRSADWLANFSLTSSSWNPVIMESPPSELRRLLFDDFSGACMSRSVGLIP
ncbi:hypothetical protein TSUD_323350 [Trifolium subterraneum]|uniref:RNase H type-1 domain-containing protein n=1 Tax=Trifolium subterraneum TaxID=3900 RepID=A0A2Z6NS16_TRISU|nr:hypothetical protein TSUD_323350 [Trifolium subterraneum]